MLSVDEIPLEFVILSFFPKRFCPLLYALRPLLSFSAFYRSDLAAVWMSLRLDMILRRMPRWLSGVDDF